MLEYFPIENFRKKLSVSLQLWQEEQQHYQAQIQLKKRNYRLIRLGAVLAILIFTGLAMLARPHWAVLTAILGFVLIGILWALTNAMQKNRLHDWRERSNRLFASSLKKNILLAFFPELQFNEDLKSAYKSLKDSHLLEHNPKPAQLYFQAEGLYHGQSLLLHRSRLPFGVFDKKSSFLGLIRAGEGQTQIYFALKSQPLEQHEAQQQHFGYFADLEQLFHFYSPQRGLLAEFIQHNEQLLQRICNLQLGYLQVAIQQKNIYCSFDNQLLEFWDTVEIEQPLQAAELSEMYEQLSKLQTLTNLLQQLHIPSSQPDEPEPL